MKESDASRMELQVNALIDGELSELEERTLSGEAKGDPVLARMIEDSRRLQRVMSELPRRSASVSLRGRLQRIPTMESRWGGGRLAFAASVLIASAATWFWWPSEPSETEVIRAQQELALAMVYLKKATHRTDLLIASTIDRGLAEPAIKHTIDSLSDQIGLSGVGK